MTNMVHPCGCVGKTYASSCCSEAYFGLSDRWEWVLYPTMIELCSVQRDQSNASEFSLRCKWMHRSKAIEILENYRKGLIVACNSWHPNLTSRPGRLRVFRECFLDDLGLLVAIRILRIREWAWGGKKVWYVDWLPMRFAEDRVMDRNGWRVKRGAMSRRVLEFGSISQ